jgi:hypothetical protein
MTKIMKICECVVQLGAEDPISGMPSAHQKCNITVADVSEISASEHEIGRMQV